MTDPGWLTTARAEVGVSEGRGRFATADTQVDIYRDAVGAVSGHALWCAAFTCWCLDENGIVHPNSTSSVDFATWGDSSEIVAGAIVVFNPRFGSTYHVGIATGAPVDGKVEIIGGEKLMDVDRIHATRWPTGE